MFSAKKTLLKHLGTTTSNAKLAVDDGIGNIHFLVTQQKQPNYLQYANDPFKRVSDNVRVKTINQYTDHNSDLYAKCNLALAADSETMSKHGRYIRRLRASVLASPTLQHDVLYRGVDLSRQEVAEMERCGDAGFFIPSFTSTSVDRTKAYSKQCLLVIRTAYCSSYGCSVTPELSKFNEEEEEVLLACYSAFRLQRVESCGKQQIISLYLDDHLSALDTITPAIKRPAYKALVDLSESDYWSDVPVRTERIKGARTWCGRDRGRGRGQGENDNDNRGENDNDNQNQHQSSAHNTATTCTTSSLNLSSSSSSKRIPVMMIGIGSATEIKNIQNWQELMKCSSYTRRRDWPEPHNDSSRAAKHGSAVQQSYVDNEVVSLPLPRTQPLSATARHRQPPSRTRSSHGHVYGHGRGCDPGDNDDNDNDDNFFRRDCYADRRVEAASAWMRQASEAQRQRELSESPTVFVMGAKAMDVDWSEIWDTTEAYHKLSAQNSNSSSASYSYVLTLPSFSGLESCANSGGARVQAFERRVLEDVQYSARRRQRQLERDEGTYTRWTDEQWNQFWAKKKKAR